MAYQILTPSEGDLAVCVGVQFARASTGNEQVCLTFEITDEASPNRGCVTTYFGTFTDASVHITVGALDACGWKGDNPADLPAAFDRGELGETVSLKIINELTQDGQGTRDKVAFVNRPGPRGFKVKEEKKIDGADLATWGQRMRTKIAAARGDSAKPKPPRGPAPPRNQAPRSSGGSHALDDSIPPPSDDDRGW